jgi:hypothetical protein
MILAVVLCSEIVPKSLRNQTMYSFVSKSYQADKRLKQYLVCVCVD